MTSTHTSSLLVLQILFISLINDSSSNQEDLQPFGSGTSQPITTIYNFPSPSEFLHKHLIPLHPVLMKGAAKLLPAYHLWSDSYFQSLQIDDTVEDALVHVEIGKKEARTDPSVKMHFHEFLRDYNHSNIYMVQEIPSFLKKDVVLPWPLQCDIWRQTMGDVIIWFSSGGTSSVIHTDSADNINCLIRGNKRLTLVDPSKYGDRIPFYPNGTYSPVDPDRVDFAKYPGLQGVEYIHVDSEPGDCLYIPFEWIHQVRSFGSNLAVNFWFNRNALEKSKLSDEDVLGECSPEFNENDTLDLVTLHGLEHLRLVELLSKRIRSHGDSINLTQFKQCFLENVKPDQILANERYIDEVLFEIFYSLDSNQDQMLSLDDFQHITAYNKKRSQDFLSRLVHLLTASGIDFPDEEEVNVDNQLKQEL